VTDYIANLTAILRETRRVLRPHGTAWIIIGDSYNTRSKVRTGAHNPGLGHDDDRVGESAGLSWREMSQRRLVKLSARSGSNLKDKDLALIPSRLAIAMIDDGWFMRSTIIWSKPYGSPERVNDRPARTHETIIMATKTDRYLYHDLRENRSSVWECAPGSSMTNGPAVLPPALAARCILSSTDPGSTVLDPFAGSGTVLHTATSFDREAVGIDLTDQWWNPAAAEPALELWS